MAWDYTDKLKEHFKNPKNILVQDESEYKFDGVGEVGNEQCGDIMKMWVVIKDDKIADCKWKTYGCASAIGSTSALSEMVIGMTVNEALAITPDDIQKELGGMPSAKIHCSVLGDKALRAAVYDYFRKTDQIDKIPVTNDMVCHCLRVTKAEIVQSVHDGLDTLEAIQSKTKAGTGCGGCLANIESIIEEAKKHGGGHH